MRKKKPNVPIAQILQEGNNVSVSLSASEIKIADLPKTLNNGTRESSLNKNPYVVLKYFSSSWQCFSKLSKDELRAFSDFLDKLSQTTWQAIYGSASKNNKTGFGYTKYDVSSMKNGKSYLEGLKNQLSQDIDFFELRVTEKMRVHGFQSATAFYLVLLDKDHNIFN